MSAIRTTRSAVCAGITIALLQACGGSSDSLPGTKVDDTFLYVSTKDFYFGTRDVGTTATQEIENANRGADLYPLNSVSIMGCLLYTSPSPRDRG